ncbi:hypothetical protein O3P69_011130 [Scylla paramamosain]|uniref:DNA polymerase eta n=1 Tax=Scylla paramamosain TaxID=85552 RepID=A0AAW0SUN6_SCYPA
MTERVVVLVDMDCFYVQVEEREQPHLRGKPAAVVQYNSWRGGGIIAVNYEARGFGVKRGMRGDQARERCPDIQLVQVPVSRGKADLTKYREAGKEVINVLVEFSDCVERASIDEAYVDLTSVVDRRMAEVEERVSAAALPSTWVVGYSGEEEVEGEKGDREASLNKWVAGLNQEDKPELEEEEEEDEEMRRGRSRSKADLRLALAAAHCEEMRRAVFTRTSFKCSAGIAHNKMLAKLSCGLHKPNQQTVLPQGKVQTLWDGLPLGKVRNLGGKLGDSLTETLGCVTMGDLSRVSLSRLAVHYDHKTAHWLHSLGRGIDTGGCHNFQGRETLDTPDKVRKWTRSLADELSERLEADKASNKRTARTLTVGVRLDGDDRWCSFTRSCRLPSYDAERICRVSLALFHHTNIAATPDVWSPSIKHISLSAGKFQDLAGSGSANIQEMFRKAERKGSATTPIPATAPNAPAKLSNVSARFFPSKTSSNSTSPPSPSSSSSSSSSSSPSSPNNNTQEEGEEDSLLDDSNTQAVMPSQSQALEETPSQSAASIRPQAEELTKRMAAKVKQETSDQQTESAREVVQGSAKSDINLEAHTSGNGYSGRGNSATDKTAGLQLNRRDGGVTESAISHVEADTGTTNQDPQNSARGERDSTTAETRPGTSDDSARECQVLALELFPDLDNVDTSLLPLLPENLRAEVEALLARHCKNTTQHCTGDATHSALPEPQETRGIMKYISRSPKKHAEKDGGSDLVQCKECQRFVSPFDLPEHLDFHVALKLQSDLRQSGAGSEGAGRVVTGRGKKRGRPSRQEAIGKKIQKLDASNREGTARHLDVFLRRLLDAPPPSTFYASCCREKRNYLIAIKVTPENHVKGDRTVPLALIPDLVYASGPLRIR